MQGFANREREIAETPIPSPLQDDTPRFGDDAEGGGAVDGVVTVEALRTAIEKGRGTITAAVATLRQVPREQNQYRLYLQCSWLGSGYFGVAVHRGRALRVHKTFDPWIVLLELFQYSGPVCVYRDADPALAALSLPHHSPA